MYCRNCGAQIPEGNKFCENCGAPAPDAKAGTGPALHRGMSRRRIIIIAVIAALVAGGIAGGIAAAVSSHNESGKYQDKIDEGNQYLDSEQYDEALSAFDDAIAIEPKKPDGYIGKATVQSKQGKHKEALDTLTIGKKEVSDEVGLEKIEELFQAETKVYEGEWKAAYRQVLEDYEYDIRAYENMEYGSGVDNTTALCDLDEDGTKELLFFAEEMENAQYRLRIFTYRDGAAQEISYTWTPSEPNMGDPRDGYRDVWAAGGTKYIVYKEKGTKGVTIYSTIMDEFIGVDIVRYEMAGQSLKPLDIIGYDFEFWNGDTYADRVDLDQAEYYRDAKASTKDDFDATFSGSRDAMEEAIFCSEDGARGDDAAIWEKAEGLGPLAMPLDAMLEELTVPAAETDTGEAGSGASAEDARYGQMMEQLLDAYQKGDRATVEDLNGQLPETWPQSQVTETEREAYDAAYADLESRGLLSEDFGGTMAYADVDNDGRPECLIDTNKSEAERMLYVYKFQDGSPVLLGSTGSGHSAFCQYPGHNGLIRYMAHMDYEQLDVVTFADGKASETPYGSNSYTQEQMENGTYYIMLGCRIDME